MSPTSDSFQTEMQLDLRSSYEIWSETYTNKSDQEFKTLFWTQHNPVNLNDNRKEILQQS